MYDKKVMIRRHFLVIFLFFNSFIFWDFILLYRNTIRECQYVRTTLYFLQLTLHPALWRLVGRTHDSPLTSGAFTYCEPYLSSDLHKEAIHMKGLTQGGP